jgi:phage nucleotide-binding protein
VAKTSERKSAKKSVGIAAKIKPVAHMENNLTMLVYGRSGTGKTEFASTFPTPALLIDINERGTETISQKSDIDVLQVETWDDVTDAYWYLKEGTHYKTIILDQITAMQDFGMSKIRDESNKKTDELFTKKNWGQLSGLLKNTISDFRDLGSQYNVVFIAHERAFDTGDEDEDSLEPSVGARVMPSVGSFLNGAVDAIGCTFISEEFVREKGSASKERHVRYSMRIGPHAFYATKVRRPVTAGPLPESIENATYQKIKALTQGKSISKPAETKKKVRKTTKGSK